MDSAHAVIYVESSLYSVLYYAVYNRPWNLWSLGACLYRYGFGRAVRNIRVDVGRGGNVGRVTGGGGGGIRDRGSLIKVTQARPLAPISRVVVVNAAGSISPK